LPCPLSVRKFPVVEKRQCKSANAAASTVAHGGGHRHFASLVQACARCAPLLRFAAPRWAQSGTDCRRRARCGGRFQLFLFGLLDLTVASLLTLGH